MNRFILLLVLVSGFLSGYLIGDYRGKDARESLKKAIETGKTLDTERDAAIFKLKTELSGINDQHHREIEAIRKADAIKVIEWRRSKDALDDKIRLATAKLTESDTRLKTLVSQRDVTTGSEEANLDMQIARLRKEREYLRREIEGNACLQARVPNSVFEALNETSTGGRKQ